MELPWLLLLLAGTGGAAGLARLPYVPRAPARLLAGRVTATTFALDTPLCVFDGHVGASDGVWLAVAFANATAAFRNPASAADIPPYGRLGAARSYMTLEVPAGAYACAARRSSVLRVGSDTACGPARGPAACNGPLPSPGPYRVKFLALGPRGPVAETQWSEPIGLRRARSPRTLELGPGRRRAAPLVIAAVLAGLGAALAVGLCGAVRAQLSRARLPGGSFAHRSYRSHHIPATPRCVPRPPAGPQGRGCCRPFQ